MKAIRAWHISMVTYIKLFREITGLSLKEYNDLIRGFTDTNPPNLDATNRLTTLRENLAAAGYKEAVEQADERFLATHRGYSSEEAWEEFWLGFCTRHNLDLRKDAL